VWRLVCFLDITCVILGLSTDDFVRKSSSSPNEVIVTTATVTPSFLNIFSPVSAADEVSEMPCAAETSVATSTQAEPTLTDTTTLAAGDKSSYSSSDVSLMIPNNVSPAVPNTSAANTSFGLMGSVTSAPVTSLLNQTSPSLTLTSSSPASAPVFAEQKIPTLLLTPPSTNTLAPTEQKIDSFKNVATTTSSGVFFKPQPVDSPSSSSLNVPDSLPKVSAGDALQVVTSSTPDGACNGNSMVPSLEEQPGHGSLSDSNSSTFISSSANNVIAVSKPSAVETTKSIFTFGSTIVSPSVNATNSTSSATISDSVFGSIFTVSSSQANVGLFGSPTTSTVTSVSSPTTASVFGAAKSDDKPSTTLPTGTLNFGTKPATTSSTPFQLNLTTSRSATNSVGGFKFDFTKGMKENPTPSTVGGFQPTINLVTCSSTVPTTTTSAITSISTTTSITVSAPASTSQSASPFKFGTPVSTPMFNFSGSTTANGPTQTSGGFSGSTFGNSQPQTDGVTQKSQQSLFTFGTGSSSQNQSLTGTFAFGGSSSSNGVKPGGFAFAGSGNLLSQPTSGMFGSGGNVSGQTSQSSGENLADQASQPVFGGSGNKIDQSQPGGGMFGTLQSSGGVFGSTQPSQSTGVLFGNSTAQSSGLFGSSGSNSGQVQSSGAIFGTGTNPSGQSLLGSSGMFGSTGIQLNQPSGGLFGSSGNLSATSTQPSSVIFGASGSLTTQASGGAFGSTGNLSVQSSQPAAGLFGGVGSSSPQTSQASGGIFGTPLQPSGGMFGSGSNVATQPTGGTFGDCGNTQPVFGFGSTSSATPAQQSATSGSTGLFGATAPFQFGAGGSSATASASQSAGLFYFTAVLIM